jgi:prevent-host-death family protein
MKRTSVAELRTNLSAMLKASEKVPLLVTRNGKPIAVVVGVEDDEEMERYLMAHSPRLQEILRAAEARFDAGQGISHDEFWAEFLPRKKRLPRTRKIKPRTRRSQPVA